MISNAIVKFISSLLSFLDRTWQRTYSLSLFVCGVQGILISFGSDPKSWLKSPHLPRKYFFFLALEGKCLTLAYAGIFTIRPYPRHGYICLFFKIRLVRGVLNQKCVIQACIKSNVFTKHNS